MSTRNISFPWNITSLIASNTFRFNKKYSEDRKPALIKKEDVKETRKQAYDIEGDIE